MYQLSDSVHYAEHSLALAEKIKYEKGTAQALLDMGRWYYFAGKPDISLGHLTKAVNIAEKIKNKQVLKGAYRYIGFIYRPHEPFKAKEYYSKSFVMCIETGDQIGASYVLSAIGNIYEGIYDKTNESNRKALDYYLRSLKIREERGSPSEQAASLNETSRIYDALGMNSKGLELRLKGLAIAEKTNDVENIVYLSNVLGNDYCKRLGDHMNGLKFQMKAYTTGHGKINNLELLHDVTKSIAKCYYETGNDKSAAQFFLLSESYNDSIGTKEIKNNYKLSEIKQDLEKEIEKQKMLVKDAELLKARAENEKQNALNRIYLIAFIFVLTLALIIYVAYRQKQKSNEELDAQNREIEMAYKTLEVSESKFKQITETINDVFYLYNIREKKYEYISPNCQELFGLPPSFFYLGKSMKTIVHPEDVQSVIDANVLVDSGLPYDIQYRIQTDQQIKWVAEKSSPIFDEQGVLIRNSGICRDITQRKLNEEIIKKKNQDITNSILYARNIQNAVLVPKHVIAERLKDFFIINKAKEIVSGDFYFYKETINGVYLAVADCTGHGVPAGFMSMLGNGFLQEIIRSNQTLAPSVILDQLRVKVINTLHQDDPDSQTKDGMDIALLCFDKDFKRVQFAGAFNSLYHIRNGVFCEIKADLFTVGLKLGAEPGNFTNHIVDLNKGDALYIMSDGYVSQFGGPNDRKFTKKQLQSLLVDIRDLPMAEQEVMLTDNFEKWKADTAQVDDVCIVGIRV